MYADHVPVINAAMRRSPKVFARGVMFAVLSARSQFVTVPEQCRDVRKLGKKSKHLWSWKFDAFSFLQDHEATLHRETVNNFDTASALINLCQIPGLGIVKGAFVLQMMGHDIACLDVRNIEREGLEPRAYRTDGIKSGAAFEAKVHRYVNQTRGRAAELWNAWCRDVAETYRISPEQISAMHLHAIVPKSMQSIEPVAPLSAEIPF